MVDLTKPAFGEGAEKINPEPVEVPTTESQPQENKVEETVDSVEEQKVPYSRLKRYRDEAVEMRQQAEEARREAELWRTRANTFEPQRVENQVDLPNYWVKLYGDSDASKEAYKIQAEENSKLRDEMRQEALRAVREEQKMEVVRTNENIETIDTHFETLSDYVGREITEKEQSEILDIVDEYTPQDEDGNYLGPLIPFEKAWTIYELQKNASKAPTQKSRNSVAGLSGSTRGESTIEEQNKNFNPLDWSAYKKRL